MLLKLKKLKIVRTEQNQNMDCLIRRSIPFQRCVENAVKANREMNNNQRWTEFKGVVLSSQKHMGH